jgi:hypothetical protein
MVAVWCFKDGRKTDMDWNAENNACSKVVLTEGRLDQLFAELGCTGLTRTAGQDAYLGPCPVHEGRDNHFRLHTDAKRMAIWWQCDSYRCEETYGASLLGLVRGVLSAQAGKPVPPEVALRWLGQFLGGTIGLSLTREQVRSRLQIPSPYFVGRGFSRDILDAAAVGYSPKLNRHVVPLTTTKGRCASATRPVRPTRSARRRAASRATGPARLAL